MKILPAIDLRDGRVVRLKQGDFDALREFGRDAVALARGYAEAGAGWLHVVDLDGARAGAPMQTELLSRIAGCGAKIQAGGGVRTRHHVEELLNAGIARVVVGSMAVRSPETLITWLQEFGADTFCLALDLHRGDDGTWRPAVDAWRSHSKADFAALLDYFAAAGLRHVLTTDIAQDGMAEGPNIELYRGLVKQWPRFAWIASGGVRDRSDIDALAAVGVRACVAGTALLEGTLPLEDIAACSRVA